MDKWEYTVTGFKYDDYANMNNIEEMKSHLNYYGSRGCELVNSFPVASITRGNPASAMTVVITILKRRVTT